LIEFIVRPARGCGPFDFKFRLVSQSASPSSTSINTCGAAMQATFEDRTHAVDEND
jgi:hypothetical protein